MDSVPSRLNSQHTTLVLDASVLINLLGTANPAILLRALNRAALVDEIALHEIRVNPMDGRPAKATLDELRVEGLLKPIRLGAEAYRIFVELTGATPPNDLDDGEAATIAQAIECQAAAVIDERKATRIVRTSFPETPVLSSMDLFGCSEVINTVGGDNLANLIYGALSSARMRVPPEFRKWVVSLVGDVRLADCPSFGCLPIPTCRGRSR
jgi:predicted nucleic acid-binding protein